jgi:hypothetical protein
MAKAHVCVQCGNNLAHIRAHREPHYGFALVICPQCGYSCVRRRHPLVAGWRRTKGIIPAARALIVRFAVLAFLIIITVIQLETISDFIGHRDGGWWSLLAWRHAAMTVAAFVGVPTTAGIMLGFLLYHLRPVVAWASWGAIFICLMGAAVIADMIHSMLVESTSISAMTIAHSLLTFLVMWTAAWPGLLLGRVCAFAYERWLTKRRHALRGRLRQGRPL